jgi:hypothetical protein
MMWRLLRLPSALLLSLLFLAAALRQRVEEVGAVSDSSVSADIDSLIAKGGCALDYGSASIYVINASDPATWSGAGVSETLTMSEP